MKKLVLLLALLVVLSSYTYAMEQAPNKIYLKVSKDFNLKDSNLLTSFQSISPKNSNVLEVKPIFNLQVNLKQKQKFGLDRWYEITVPNNKDISKQIDLWNNLKEIEQASPAIRGDFASLPDDPDFDYQWYHVNYGDNPGPPGSIDADIDSDEAWAITTGSNILVGDHDIGIDWQHEDLVNNIWQNLDEDADHDGSVLQFDSTLNKYVFDPDDLNGIDDDHDGFVDDLIGWDFKDNDNNPTYNTSEYGYVHGTLTAGLLAADSNNNKGISGTCWNCKIVATRGYYESGNSIEYLADKNVRVISLSLMLPYQGGPIEDAINYAQSKGVVIVASAGNDGSEIGTNPLCKDNEVICVTASDKYDQLTSFSDYGMKTDVSAPGYYMFSTNVNNQYVTATGTSHSSPLVSGTIALMLSVNPNLNPGEILSIIQSTTDPLVNPTKFAGTGRLNMFNAVTEAKDSIGKGFPIASLDSNTQTTITNNYNITGKASGTNFDHYDIYYGEGVYPSTWTLAYSSKIPVENGLLYTINSRPFVRKQTIKLEVYDTYGKKAIDYIYGIERQLPKKFERELPF